MPDRLDYEGLVELDMAEGCYGVVHLDDSGKNLAEALYNAVGEDGEDGWFPERKIRAKITVEILDPDVQDPPDPIATFVGPAPPVTDTTPSPEEHHGDS